MLVRSTEREHHLYVGYGWQPYSFLSRLYLRFSALCGEMDIYERIIDANAHMCECVCLPHSPSLPLCVCVCAKVYGIFFMTSPPLQGCWWTVRVIPSAGSQMPNRITQ